MKKALWIIALVISGFGLAKAEEVAHISDNGDYLDITQSGYYFSTSSTGAAKLTVFVDSNYLKLSFADGSYRKINLNSKIVEEVSTTILPYPNQQPSFPDNIPYRETKTYSLTATSHPSWTLLSQNQTLLNRFNGFVDRLGFADLPQKDPFRPLNTSSMFDNLPAGAAESDTSCALESANYSTRFNGYSTIGDCLALPRLRVIGSAVLLLVTCPTPAATVTCASGVYHFADSVAGLFSADVSCMSSAESATNAYSSCLAEQGLTIEDVTNKSTGGGVSTGEVTSGPSGGSSFSVDASCELWVEYTGTTADGLYCESWLL
ncbi:hypothetical protein LZP69_09545 [Shewanella sp. AS1]|uniref:hypothetical protein n=1 Tax=Shewanella sp. AS1 TaxID=2907626 RepID=UPI001F3B6867|nr:hypothetical protein [Shewanella sp. AS1]MCE9679415.1 hypothetical protein [Shewanella sp. AS1]